MSEFEKFNQYIQDKQKSIKKSLKYAKIIQIILVIIVHILFIRLIQIINLSNQGRMIMLQLVLDVLFIGFYIYANVYDLRKRINRYRLTFKNPNPTELYFLREKIRMITLVIYLPLAETIMLIWILLEANKLI